VRELARLGEVSEGALEFRGGVRPVGHGRLRAPQVEHTETVERDCNGLVVVHSPPQAQGALERRPGHVAHPEGRVQLADDVVRRGVAELELLAPRADLLLHEVPHRVADHLVLVTPLIHMVDPRFRP